MENMKVALTHASLPRLPSWWEAPENRIAPDTAHGPEVSAEAGVILGKRQCREPDPAGRPERALGWGGGTEELPPGLRAAGGPVGTAVGSVFHARPWLACLGTPPSPAFSFAASGIPHSRYSHYHGGGQLGGAALSMDTNPGASAQASAPRKPRGDHAATPPRFRPAETPRQEPRALPPGRLLTPRPSLLLLRLPGAAFPRRGRGACRLGERPRGRPHGSGRAEWAREAGGPGRFLSARMASKGLGPAWKQLRLT